MEIFDNDIWFMRKALAQARRAFSAGEVPVGAVVVKDGNIISRGHNRKEGRFLPTRHGEIEAIEKACRKLKNWRLTGCTLYCTLEPCMMCTGAILESRIKRVVYGAPDLRMGFLNNFKINRPPYAYDVEVTPGVMEDETAQIMRDFFIMRRGG